MINGNRSLSPKEVLMSRLSTPNSFVQLVGQISQFDPDPRVRYRNRRRSIVAELDSLADLPVGAVDPTIREDQLLDELADIEAVIREELGHVPTD
jgi:hypothetical protein